MTHAAQMQQPSENIHSMFPAQSEGMDNMASETHVDSYRSLDPARASLEDYNRSMLQYTQRQMSSFVDADDSHRGSGSSSRSSQSSGQSGYSSSSSGNSGSNISHQANAPVSPGNNAARLSDSKVSGRDMAGTQSAGY